ncbi:MAG: selenide, water dikinase SelD [Thermodesulfovibrionales bacterium]|nr:selenide, water dikinase SelD [Thermodesulfovibrionales bacterium]
MGPSDLEGLLSDLDFHLSPSVIVGPGDDAGVFILEEKWIKNGEWAFVETVDIITPLVDDPFLFGAISATNSLSDIYAMGGRPLTALAILGYDPCDFDRNTIKEILRGCISQLELAGVSLLGGHTVEDPEVKFGLSVTGIVLKNEILRKEGAMPGDLLCLTKPLGTGLATTALKAQRLSEEWFSEVLSWMLMLNDKARDIALKAKARSCTDITGFGLLGLSQYDFSKSCGLPSLL